MTQFDDRLDAIGALTGEDRKHIQELLGQWQLLSDLSFADLVLWVPKRSDYLTWPQGYLAVAHIRPTTAATVFTNDVIGQSLDWGENSRLDKVLRTGEISLSCCKVILKLWQ